MKFLKIIISFALVFSICLTVWADDIQETDETISINSEVTDSVPLINSRYVAVFERNSKTFLYEKNSQEKCKMASTTKVMTSLIIIENCNLDDVVTVSSKSANTGGSRLGLHTDDTITVNDLLYGLMLCSGNDAAVALAEFCSGSVEEFASLMNAKAHELNLSSTNFVTPHGLDNDNHYTTAYDYAILTDFALNNPQFLQIVGTKYYNVTINGIAKSIHNTNELLGIMPSVYGVKTGYTSQAGRCLITAANQNNLDIIVIVFGADTKKIRTDDSANLINYVFSNYEAVNISDLIENKYSDYKNYILPYVIIDKASSELSSKLDEIQYSYYPVKKDNLNSISLSISEEKLYAPISKNQKIAEIDLFIGDKKICTTDILADKDVNKKTSFDYMLFFILNYKNFYQMN